MAKKTKNDRPVKSYYEKARDLGVDLRDQLRGESSSAEDFACALRTAGMVLLAEADRMDPPRKRKTKKPHHIEAACTGNCGDNDAACNPRKQGRPDPDPTNGEGAPAWDDIDPAHENN
jgi:hypothetical protein